jgi:drug/metabolite transporter (DMT)-like permease
MSTALKILVFSALCLIWSSTWVMIKVGLQEAPPMTAAGLRFIIASVVIFSILLYRRIALPRTRRFFVLTLFLGLFQMAVPYGLVYWGEQRLSSGLTAILYSTMPLTVAILARFMLKDPLTRRKIAGILVGTLGVYVIFAESVSLGGPAGAHGIIAILVSVLLASLSSVVLKKFSQGYNPFASIFLPMAYAGILLTATGLLTEKSSPLRWGGLTFITVLYLAVFGSVAAFSLYYWIIKHIDVTVLSYQTFIIPILASLIGWIFLRETVTLKVALGGGLIVIGIALAVLPHSYKRFTGARP